MKKLALTTLACLALAPLTAFSQTIYDGFDYDIGSTLASNSSWAAVNTGTAPIIASGNLSVSGLVPPTGNRVTWESGNIQEAVKTVDTYTSGSIFYSFSFQLSSLPTQATYSFSLSHSNTLYASAVWLRADAGGTGFNIGLSNRSNSTAEYSSTVFDLNTTIFLVGSYTIAEGGGNSSSLWINPNSSSFGGLAPTASLTATGGNDQNTISQFLLRGAAGSPAGTMDELRIGDSFAAVTPVPEPSVVVLLGLGLAFVLWRVRARRMTA